MVHTLLSTRNVSNRAISFFVSVKSFPDADDDEDEDKDVVVVVCSCVNSSACFGLCRCAATREFFPEASLHRVHVEQRSRLVDKVVDKDDDEEEDEDDIFSFFVYLRLSLLLVLLLLRVFRMTRDSDDDDDDDDASSTHTHTHTHTHTRERERCTKESRSRRRRRRRRRRSLVGWTKTRDGLCISVDYKYSILKSVLVHTHTRKVANKKKEKRHSKRTFKTLKMNTPTLLLNTTYESKKKVCSIVVIVFFSIIIDLIEYHIIY